MESANRFPLEALTRYLVMFDLDEPDDVLSLRGHRDLSRCVVTFDRPGARARYLVTLFEALTFDQVPFQIRLMSHLHRSGLPVPAPKATLDGMTMTILSGVPALLTEIPGGSAVEEPTPAQCRAFGATLAALHAEAGKSGLAPTQLRGGDRLGRLLGEAAGKLADSDARLLAGALDDTRAALGALTAPPSRGIVHGHPVRDHALFHDGTLTSLGGFQRAAEDWLLYDLALAVADWCTTPAGALEPELSSMMASAYCAARPPTAGDRASLPHLSRMAATELWLDALFDATPRAPEELALCRARWRALEENPLALA